MLDAMQQLMTGDAEFFDQAFLEELRACWDETHTDLASAQDSAWQVTRYTGRMGWMANRKWKEVKQQPSMLPSPAVPGCCLFSSISCGPSALYTKTQLDVNQISYSRCSVAL